MRVGIAYGQTYCDFEVQARSLVGVERAPIAPALTDPAAAMRHALAAPVDWPALCQALTPDDHVAILVDERLPQLGQLLAPVLEHLALANVTADAVTLLCASTGSRQEWVDDLPDAFEEVRIEVHAPNDRRKLSYLATTRQGRRIYLNRTAVDADQLVILTGCGYDPLRQHPGVETAIYPALSDEATRTELLSSPNMLAVQREAEEVAWLLGAPFLVQVIEGAGDEIAHILGGSLASRSEGRRLRDQRWRLRIEQPADLVVASVSGDPSRHDFTTWARALSSAARVVQPGGRIVLLAQGAPTLGSTVEVLRQAESADEALAQLVRDRNPQHAAPRAWAEAVLKAQVYLLSDWPDETAEELFTTPLTRAEQTQRLLAAAGSCLFLPDAHKTHPVADAPTAAGGQ